MPFEPKRKAPKQGKPSGEPGEKAVQQANKPANKPASQPANKQASKQTGKPARQQSSKQSSNRQGNREGGIPDVVSRRMVKRIAWCSGVPTLLGMSTFVVSYLAVSNGFPLPTYAVLLVSLGWFGLGVLGVSYGVLSASWDETAGSLLGWNEVQTNWA
ncbi:MAG: photosystem II biosynthesis protein, partial [Elainella sp.]